MTLWLQVFDDKINPPDDPEYAQGFCVGLILLTVMLSPGMPEGIHQGPYYLWQGPQTFTNESQCSDWTSPCHSYYDCKMYLSNKHQGTGKNKVYYSQVLVGMEPHSKVTGRERERQHAPGALPLLGSQGGCLGFYGFTLYWQI